MVSGLTQLAEANEQFNELFLNRTEANSSADPVSMRDLRVRIQPLYYRLRDLIASYHVINNGEEPYGSTVKQLNTLIDKYNQILASRKGKRKEEDVAI
ncbi:DUF6261 family protein [Reichenbachiella sp. MSK19-1]|uniref:DUF6261 family protein n=1 Tax=Reichenbachiella sp. MSK19-1 TaxID=1897631 RepID=UPI000E6C5EF9|nr:DUF6261 family protein [Reichenbachiella sp. MSK19-1]RJE74577.1 hypothetical protein BGP76_15655 [Reichenbachiella sp. MSK19-1]